MNAIQVVVTLDEVWGFIEILSLLVGAIAHLFEFSSGKINGQ